MIEANENCKVALITGGNKGLGLEIARQLAKKGVHVVFGSRDLVRGESAAKTLQNEGLSARAVKLNVTNADDSAALPEFLSREFGRLDILVNNAGAMNESHGEWQISTVTTISEAELRATFDANFFRRGCGHARVIAAFAAKRRGAHRQSIEYSGVVVDARRSAIADLPDQTFRLQRVENRAQCVHESSRLRVARHENQSQRGASGLGSNRYGN